MLRSILASLVVSSVIGCAFPVEAEAPAPTTEHAPPATPDASGCGGEVIAQLAAPEFVHDLTVAGGRLAWIGAVGFVHTLDLATRRVDLYNTRADRLASYNGELAWASSSRVIYGSTALTPQGSVAALTLDATHVTYVERLNLDYARVVRRDRTTLEALSLGDGPLAPVVAVDGNNAWYGVSATSDTGTSSVFRRVSLAGGAPTDYDAVPGTPVKLAANNVGATALLSTSLLVSMSPNDEHPRAIYQGSAVRDFAVDGGTVYFTEGKTVGRSEGGRVEPLLTSSCEVGAIAADGGSVYFVAWDERGGAIYRYAER